MKQLVFVMGLLLASACGGGGIEGEMKGFKDKMCKCADKECADKTLKEYNDWAKGKREAAKELSKSEREKLDGIDQEIKACRRKLRDGDGGDQPAGDPPGADKPAE
jgi:hypothetical protein